MCGQEKGGAEVPFARGMRRGGREGAGRGNERGGFPPFPVGVIDRGHHHVSLLSFPPSHAGRTPDCGVYSVGPHLRTPQPVPTLRIPGGGGVHAPRDREEGNGAGALRKDFVSFGPVSLTTYLKIVLFMRRDRGKLFFLRIFSQVT